MSVFRKLTPEVREANRKSVLDKFEAKHQSQQRMIDHLQKQMNEGEITNEWEMEFISSVMGRFSAGIPLSDRQDEILTNLFEKY